VVNWLKSGPEKEMPMSRKVLTGLCLVLMVVVVAWLAQKPAAIAAQSATKPRFALNLTSGRSDLHRSTMALALANHAMDDGREVIIFLNVRAPELARKDGTDRRLARILLRKRFWPALWSEARRCMSAPHA
jgi:hypothetical protein